MAKTPDLIEILRQATASGEKHIGETAEVELEAYLRLEPNTENASRAKQVLNHLFDEKEETSDSPSPLGSPQ